MSEHGEPSTNPGPPDDNPTLVPPGGYPGPPPYGTPPPYEAPPPYGAQPGYATMPYVPVAPQPKRRRWILPVALVTALAIVAVLAGLAYLGTRSASHQRPSGASAPTSASLVGAEHLTTPKVIAGLRLSTDPRLVEAADITKGGLEEAVPKRTASIGAVYQNQANLRQQVMVVAVLGPVANPVITINAFFFGLKSSTLKLGEVKDVDPGPLGGQAKCASGVEASQRVVLCVWAEPNGLGVVASYNQDERAAGDLFRTFRAAVVTSN